MHRSVFVMATHDVIKRKWKITSNLFGFVAVIKALFIKVLTSLPITSNKKKATGHRMFSSGIGFIPLTNLFKVKFINSYDLSQSLQKYNSRKYERKHVRDQEWLFVTGFRPAPKSSRQAHGSGVHESVRSIHRILQRFGLDLEETVCVPSIEILRCHRKQRRLVHFDTARRANWIVDGTVVFYCGISRRETRMAGSFERL